MFLFDYSSVDESFEIVAVFEKQFQALGALETSAPMKSRSTVAVDGSRIGTESARKRKKKERFARTFSGMGAGHLSKIAVISDFPK